MRLQVSYCTLLKMSPGSACAPEPAEKVEKGLE
jgi:hypothetical protein